MATQAAHKGGTDRNFIVVLKDATDGSLSILQGFWFRTGNWLTPRVPPVSPSGRVPTVPCQLLLLHRPILGGPVARARESRHRAVWLQGASCRGAPSGIQPRGFRPG